MEITSIAILPMLMMFYVNFFNAYLTGRYKGYIDKTQEHKHTKFVKTEALIYIIILTTVTVLMLFLPIIKIDITSGGYNHDINLNGFEIIRDYVSLGEGYRLAAYLLIVMLISVGFCLIINITSYLTRSKQFISIVKFSTIINVLFVFVVGLSGYYFQIARDINKALIADIAEFYGYTITNINSLEYVVSTDAMYALGASTLVLIIMFTRKVFDVEESSLIETGLLESNLPASKALEEETTLNFDPSYSFSELDSKIKDFKNDLSKRKALAPKEVTLNGLVNFVVEYARNSRLHLSYQPETSK